MPAGFFKIWARLSMGVLFCLLVAFGFYIFTR
jgi:hypothetical protein